MKRKLYTLEEDLAKRLKNPEFKKSWEDSEMESQLSRALIEARLLKKISQRELARKANTTQAVVSRIESMNMNPSIGLLKRVAGALSKKLIISFEG